MKKKQREDEMFKESKRERDRTEYYKRKGGMRLYAGR